MGPRPRKVSTRSRGNRSEQQQTPWPDDKHDESSPQEIKPDPESAPGDRLDNDSLNEASIRWGWPRKDCFTPGIVVARSSRANNKDVYGKLNRIRREIRLVEVLAGKDSDSIRCRSTSFALNEAPAYTALSYTWGKPDPSCKIELNGHDVAARKNLWRFLHQVRNMSKWQNTKFWIDALCINQSNNKERTHQVNLMSQIYSGAVQVLVWLGPGYAYADGALKTLRKFSKSSSRMDKFWLQAESSALRRLCERDYWTRLWVLQELVLAKNISILCGGELLPWSMLTNAVDSARSQVPLPRRDIITDVQAIIDSHAASMIEQTESAKRGFDSLYDQIVASTNLGCSEPRDKVFALLGISRHGVDFITPDYTLELSDLLNLVLKNEHRHRVPKSLLEVKYQCGRLADELGVDPALVYSFKGPDPESSFDFESFPLLDEKSGLTFWWAATRGHEAVQCLWAQENGSEPLHQALSYLTSIGEDGICHFLLETGTLGPFHGHGAYLDQYYHNPLIEAARGGSIRIVRRILRHHAPNPSPALLDAALDSASANGHLETVLFLLDRRSETMPDDHGSFLLQVRTAAAHNHSRMVEELISHAQSYTNDVNSLAHVLVEEAKGKEEHMQRALISGVRSLRNSSADIDFTPSLHGAIASGSSEIFDLLLDYDLTTAEEVNSRYKQGTLLAWTIRYGLTREACRLIQRPDVDINIPLAGICDHDSASQGALPCSPGPSPLLVAIRCYNTPVLEALLAREDVQINVGGDLRPLISTAMSYTNPRPPVDWRSALEYGEPVMDMLLRNPKFRVHAESADYHLILSLAITHQRPAIVGLVLEKHNVVINWHDDVIRSMLSTAIDMELDEIVLLLIERQDLDSNRRVVDDLAV